MKSEFNKQLAATEKAFKPVEAYQQQQEKMAKAFEALDAKIAKTEQEHKAFLQKAGSVEAKRLLGETSDAEAETLDMSLISIRDQQDRLAAARQSLTLQKDELDQQIKALHEQAIGTLSELKNTLIAELDQDMRQAAALITSAVNRMYAFSQATGIGSVGDKLLGIVIPSLSDGANLFQQPVFHHPIHQAVIRSWWDSDREAMALHDRLRDFGIAYRVISRDERHFDEKAYQAEREAERRSHADAE